MSRKAIVVVSCLISYTSIVRAFDEIGVCPPSEKGVEDCLAEFVLKSEGGLTATTASVFKALENDSVRLSPDGVRKIARSFASRFSVYEGLRFAKCAGLGAECSLQGGPDRRGTFKEFVNAYLDLLAEFPWTYDALFGKKSDKQYSYSDERVFWRQYVERHKDQSQAGLIASQVCRVLTGNTSCEGQGIADLTVTVKPQLKDGVASIVEMYSTDVAFRCGFSRFISRIGETIPLRRTGVVSEEGELCDSARTPSNPACPESGKRRSIELQLLALEWWPLNVRAGRLAVELTSADAGTDTQSNLKLEYGDRFAQLRSDIRKYLDVGRRRYVGAARNISSMGLYRLGYSGLFREYLTLDPASHSLSSEEFGDALAILASLERLYPEASPTHRSNPASLTERDRELLCAAGRRVAFLSLEAREQIGCPDGTFRTLPDIGGDHTIVVSPPREGDRLLEGVVAGPGRILDALVTDCSDPRALASLGSRYVGGLFPVFSMPLFRELRSSDCVVMRSSDAQYVRIPVQTASNSFGRIRLYGRGGMEIFGRGLGAHVAPTGALTFDYAFRTITTNLLRDSPVPVGFHFFSEGRIESVSVTAELDGASKAAVRGGSIGSRCGSNFTCSGPPFSGQSGEVGIYLPIPLSITGLGFLPLRWNYRGSEIGVFIAPIWKVGTTGRYRAPQDGIIEYEYKGRTLKGKELRVGPYSYYASGLRIGSMRYFSDTSGRPHRGMGRVLLSNTAPVSGWNLDAMIGRWQNFGLPTSGALPWRFEMRGTAQIPSTPWFAGALLNVGAGPNDYRLFVGMRAEFGQMVSRVKWAKKRKRPLCVPLGNGRSMAEPCPEP